MEADEDVVVVISSAEEKSDFIEPNNNEEVERSEKLGSGSGSFSKYLQLEPPLAIIQVAQLTNQEQSLRSRKKMSPSSEITKNEQITPQNVNEEPVLSSQRSMPLSTQPNTKSRLVEPAIPSSWKTKTPPITPRTPKTPLMVSPKEDDDNDVYYTEVLQANQKKKPAKKLKILFLIEFGLFICVTMVLILSLTVDKLKNCLIWSLELWKWCVLVLVIFCGRLCSEWFKNLVVFLIEKNFLLKKKVLYFVYNLEKSVRVFIWLGLILLTWGLLINRGVRRPRNTAKILNYITRALASTLVGAGTWIIKTLFVKILASSFHVKLFFDRIQESIFHQYVIQTLSGPPLMKDSESVNGSSLTSGRLSFRGDVKKEGEEKKEDVIDVQKLQKMKREKVSAWTMRGLIKVIRKSGFSTLSHALEDTEEGDDENDRKITCEWEAQNAGYAIFANVARHGHKYIVEDDLLRFMNSDEVNKMLPLFEGAAETGRIHKKSFSNWVVNVYKERKFLALSLNDTKTAIEELNKLVSGLLLIALLIVWLLLMGFATTKVLLFISSQLLLGVFMFGNSAKTAFEAIIFVFVMHPFDVGDRCVIDGVQVIVEEVNILTTIFLRYDNEKIFFPNSILATKAISNFNRSPEMSDTVEFDVDASTSIENIIALKAKIKTKLGMKVDVLGIDNEGRISDLTCLWYIDSKPEQWRPKHSIRVREIQDVMKMSLYVTHTINFQNYDEKSERRSNLVLELKKIFEEIGIKYHLLA